jgi:alpha-1,2-mannosyltransferase
MPDRSLPRSDVLPARAIMRAMRDRTAPPGSSTPPWARASALALLLLGAAWTAILLHERGEYVDLAVYRWGARHAFDASQLYDLAQPVSGLRFTYAPFALLVLWPFGAAGLLAPAAFTALSLLALARTSWLLAAHTGTLLPRVGRGWMATALLGATLLVEPAGGTLLLGQVNLLLLWLVVEGLLGPLWERRGGAWGGVLVGIACAIKLTPGIFLVLLALAGRWRATITGAATVLATIAIGWVLLPEESRAYWTGAGTDAARVGALEYAPNQSLDGVVWRLAGPGGNDAAWIAAALVLGGGALLLARRAWLQDERATSVGLAGLAGLLASPVSWTHHWVVLLPLVVGLLGTARHPVAVRVLTLAACAVLSSRVVWRVPQLDGREFHLDPLQQLAASSYVLASLALLVAAWLAVGGLRRRPSGPRSPRASR